MKMIFKVFIVLNFSVMALVFGEDVLKTNSCLVSSFYGSTYYVRFDEKCYKVELFDRGNIIENVRDKNCTESTFRAESVSLFDYGEDNEAFFKPGDFGWTGSLKIYEESTLDAPITKVISRDEDFKTFKFEVMVPSCDYGRDQIIANSYREKILTPSLTPSSEPSKVPSLQPISSDDLSSKPSQHVLNRPLTMPSISPSSVSSSSPSIRWSGNPSFHPIMSPITAPTHIFSYSPSEMNDDSAFPTLLPSIPSHKPSSAESHTPT